MSLSQPLPERLRPSELALFVGQSHLAERLTTLLEGPRLPSLLLFGPPGCGKSTLALLLARARGGNVLRLSAPEAGLQQLRRQLTGVDILVLDELHRFSKAQQDFFLPLLESGDLTMIATTTENPSFSVTRQLLSRLHVLRLRQLGRPELLELGKRGAAALSVTLNDEILDFLSTAAHGDARTMLNLVEYASSLPEEKRNLPHVKATLPEIMARHDKDGDSHYEYASALIKSIRGSDPDAALYYAFRLIEGGCDPLVILRRLVAHSSEDVGMADPNALVVATSAMYAFEKMGAPEGLIPMSNAIIYVCEAQKSNSVIIAMDAAKRAAREVRDDNIPPYLMDNTFGDKETKAQSANYKYPHNYGGWVEQQYLPDSLKDEVFYRPQGKGYEKVVEQVRREKGIKKGLPPEKK